MREPGRVPPSAEPPATPKPLTLPRLLWRGLRRRCPLCGGGDCFSGFFTKRERCPRCSFPLVREEGHWIGALGMNTVATFGLMLLTLTVTVALSWEHRRAVAIVLPTVLAAGLTPILFFGSSQTLWSAIDLAMRPLEPDDDVDPRWIPVNTKPREGW
jgi:uncharacterized protein (DUF983 family)